MKRIFLTGIILSCVAFLAFAQEPAVPTATEPGTAPVAASEFSLTGDIIDNMCASSQKPQDLSAFVKTHTKQCALLPACVAAGYSIYTADGKLLKFDKDSNAKIEEFLKKEGSKLQVVLTVKKVGEELSLVNIENQK